MKQAIIDMLIYVVIFLPVAIMVVAGWEIKDKREKEERMEKARVKKQIDNIERMLKEKNK